MTKSQALTFWPEMRRRIDLENFHPLFNEESEKRIRFDFVMPITGQSYSNMPRFIDAEYRQMETEGNAIKEIPLTTEIENVTVRAFATDQSDCFVIAWELRPNAEGEQDTRQLILEGCTLRNFKLTRITRQRLVLVALAFSITTKSTSGLCAWAHDFMGQSLFAEFQIVKPDKKTQAEANGQKALPIGAAALVDSKCPSPGCKKAADHDGEHEPPAPDATNVESIDNGKKRGRTKKNTLTPETVN